MDHAFANILLTGPCNLRCPDCIGHFVRGPRASTLDTFPLPGWQPFLDRLRDRKIHKVCVTGVDTEPMLFHHTERLVTHLRQSTPNVDVSVHTNATLVLSHLPTFHLYDRATLSFPSRVTATYQKMTGSSRVPDIATIFERSRIPIKVSILMSEHNRMEIPSLLSFLRNLGCRRVTLRRRYGDPEPCSPLPGLHPVRHFGGNPVFLLDGLEVTVWDFERTRLPCLQLFPDGSVRDGYLITEAADA